VVDEAEELVVALGEPAPDFTLADEQGRSVTLSSFRGKQPVVLVFYPGDSTPLCTTQLCEIRDAWKEFEDAGAAVLGINPFGAESHRRFAERYDFPFPLLVDPGNRVARRYRAIFGWGPLSIVHRTVYVVGTDGRVLFAQRGKPAPEAILAALRSAD
jgi:peroxiredoxin Q/BCP